MKSSSGTFGLPGFCSPNGGAAMTLEVGVRFLTDYVEGDHYFRVLKPRHNLVRARSQLALARSMASVLPMG